MDPSGLFISREKPPLERTEDECRCLREQERQLLGARWRNVVGEGEAEMMSSQI
jgi:hypothetical protein